MDTLEVVWEGTRDKDSGCELCDTCLTCPVVICKFDREEKLSDYIKDTLSLDAKVVADSLYVSISYVHKLRSKYRQEFKKACSGK